ncbi:MAG TPA: hypothetical protein VHX44_10720, partial [Planctomycetota bacterium]|nr:hypothetical protein [Planctomycetota bacterium]
ETGIEDFKVLKQLPSSFVEYRDTATASYWRYNPITQVFWTWDDATAIAAKRAYVESKDFGDLIM